MENRILERLNRVYPPAAAARLDRDLRKLAGKYPMPASVAAPAPAWSRRDALLIAYADTVRAPGEAPLRTLTRLLDDFGCEFTWTHLLPFYPYSSDDGFAVTDYRSVRPELGTWDDLAALARRTAPVFDAVVNHASSRSRYVERYLAGDPDFADFFIDLDPAADTSSVLRTRNLPLLHEFPAADGTIRHLWTTFGPDQIDFNFRNPAVLLEIADILLFYASRGARMVRLDAIPYLWKTMGTRCAHLPETHELIKLFRDLFDIAAPGVRILTETNVPHRENLAYFGRSGDEAQLIYNFTLAPLIVHAFLRSDARTLTAWSRSVGFVSDRATYLNITATHDGIGVRPTEGILDDAARREMVDFAVARGGAWTGKTNADGSIAPYELNLNYFDAVNDPRKPGGDDAEIDRFLLSQAISVVFMGIPGIYLHSLLGSRGDAAAVRATGRARSINRAVLDDAELRTELGRPASRRARVLAGIRRLLRIRGERPELDPASPQEVADLDPRVFSLLRTAPDSGRRLAALFNFSDDPVSVVPPASGRFDLWSGETLNSGPVELGPRRFRLLVETEA